MPDNPESRTDSRMGDLYGSREPPTSRPVRRGGWRIGNMRGRRWFSSSPLFLWLFILLLAYSLFTLVFTFRYGWNRILQAIEGGPAGDSPAPVASVSPAPVPAPVSMEREFERLPDVEATNLAARIVSGARGARRTMDDVYQMAGRGLLDDSIRQLRRQLETTPSNLLIRRELARLLLQMDEEAEAAALLVDLVDKTPSDAVARRLLCRALYARGAFEDVVVLGEWALSEESSDAEIRYVMAAALFRLQRYDEAVVHLRRLSEHPDLGPSSRLMLGQAYLRMGHPGRGIVFFTDTLKTNPKDREAYRSLAECYAADNQVEAVIDVLSRAVENIGRDEVATWLSLPFMEKIRQDPQYAAFERRLGMEGYRSERPLSITGLDDGELIEVKKLDFKIRNRP